MCQYNPRCPVTRRRPGTKCRYRQTQDGSLLLLLVAAYAVCKYLGVM